MPHAEFVELRMQNKVVAGIDNAVAMSLVKELPASYQAGLLFWSWVWLLSIPAGILVAIFYKWWVGLLVVFFVGPVLAKANKKSAADLVLDHATRNREFFDRLVERNLLVFREVA